MSTEASSLEVFLSEDIAFDPARPVWGGHLFKGRHSAKGHLALKRSRSHTAEDSDSSVIRCAQNAYIAEAKIWRRLQHPNVLPCLGLLLISWDDVYLVSPWMDNGSLVRFIAYQPEVDRTQLLRDVADGLAYLHENGIVHGDVKGLNALVTAERRVALCDFGLSKLASSVNPVTGGVGTLYWQSPELLLGGPRTKEADVYAFGIMVYEILSGQVPFAQYQAAAAIVAIAHRDERPPKDPQRSPKGESYDEHWRIAERCWAKSVHDRPEMRKVLAIWPCPEKVECQRLLKLAKTHMVRYQEQHDPTDIREAMRFYREVLTYHPSGHPHRPITLNYLGGTLLERYLQGRTLVDFTEAVMLYREAVQLRPPGHPGRIFSLESLGNALCKGYEREENVRYIAEAIIAYREAVQLCPLGNPDGAISFTKLGNALFKRYKCHHGPSDIMEAITSYKAALELRPARSTDRVIILDSLGSALYERYMQAKSSLDIDEAIKFYQEAVLLSPSRHPNHVHYLCNLSNALQKRYAKRSDVSDLREATQALESVLRLVGTDHPLHLTANRRLAKFLLYRYL